MMKQAVTPIQALLGKTKQGKKALSRESLIVSVTEQVWQALEEAGISKADLARLLDTSKSNVTQMLSGQRNMTLGSLADIADALNMKAHVIFAKPDCAVFVNRCTFIPDAGIRVIGPKQITSSSNERDGYKVCNLTLTNKMVVRATA